MTSSSNSLHILVVEDNLLNQKLIEQLLKSFSYTSTIAENGQIALDYLSENPDVYDLVLMDLHMPVLDGYKTTEAIRTSDAPYKDITIYGLSADAPADVLDQIEKVGMDGYLSKPIEIPTLHATLNKHL